MKTIFKLTMGVFFILIICSTKNLKAQEYEPILDSMDIVYLKSFADSVDIQSLGNIYEIAYSDLYHGNNNRANRILDFVISNIKEPNYEKLISTQL